MMKKLVSVLMTAVLAMAFALPLNAGPISVPKPELVRADALLRSMTTIGDNGDASIIATGGRIVWKRRHAWRDCRYDGVTRVAITAATTAIVTFTRATIVVPGVSIYLEF